MIVFLEPRSETPRILTHCDKSQNRVVLNVNMNVVLNSPKIFSHRIFRTAHTDMCKDLKSAECWKIGDNDLFQKNKLI